MRLRKVKNALEMLEKSPYYIQNPFGNKGHWQNVFPNKQPIHLEIGMGKGQFLIEMAKKYPKINFIGIEKYDSVLVRAIEKVQKEEIPNLFFLCVDAKEISNVFAKEITTIYLNFSDPWPKTRHAKRRLTSPDFLNVYDNIFVNKKEIIQKTDNPLLFTYSLEELSKHGYVLEKISLDLAKEKIANVKTEYEEKFTELGYPIYYVHAYK